MARWAPTRRRPLQAGHWGNSASWWHRKNSLAAVAIFAVCGAGTAGLTAVTGPNGGKLPSPPAASKKTLSAQTKRTALVTTGASTVPPASLFRPSIFNTIVVDGVVPPPGVHETWPVLENSSQYAADIVADYKAEYGA